MTDDDQPTTGSDELQAIITELREAYESATPGPWTVEYERESWDLPPYPAGINGPISLAVDSGDVDFVNAFDEIPGEDLELIVKAHNYLPWLLDELELTESYRRAAGSLFDDEHLQSETAHVHMRREAERENERLRKRLVVLMRESAQLEERLSRFEETLTTIANQDYRGNRCSCSTLAYKALKAGVGE